MRTVDWVYLTNIARKIARDDDLAQCGLERAVIASQRCTDVPYLVKAMRYGIADEWRRRLGRYRPVPQLVSEVEAVTEPPETGIETKEEQFLLDCINLGLNAVAKREGVPRQRIAKRYHEVRARLHQRLFPQEGRSSRSG